MISEKLFELAFSYKKTRLWKMMWDTEIFAVRLPDGETGYCSVMGAVGEHCALSLYVGEKGLNSLRIILRGPSILAEMAGPEFLLSQDCLQCAFENKDDLAPDEVSAVREYTRGHGISLRGRNAFPRFVKYRPNYLPWFLRDEPEQLRLCEALAAAIEVSEKILEKGKKALGLQLLNESTASVPLLERTEDGFVWSRTDLPPAAPVRYPEPEFINDIAAAKLKRLKKAGIWECEIFRFPEPMQDDPAQAPYFPVLLLVASGSGDTVLPPQLSERYDDEPEELLERFANLFLERQFRPAMLSVRDTRTKVLVEKFCERAGIRVRLCEDLPVLDEALDSLMDFMGLNDSQDDRYAEILDMLLHLDDSELGNLPDEIREQFAAILEQENLPDELAFELADKIHVDSDVRKPPQKAPARRYEWVSACQSYIISVSCGRGCYRHIQISEGDTLADLHEAIQTAFGFDNDHAYAFFMDNALWSDRDAYFAYGVEAEDERTADGCRLNQLRLTAGKQFKYLFDFGDEWVFQCKVLRVLDEETKEPAVVRVRGESPEQYPS